MEYDELVYACALNRIFNYACDKARALVEMYPCPEDIFRMGRGDLEEIFGKGSPYVDHILNPSFLADDNPPLVLCKTTILLSNRDSSSHILPELSVDPSSIKIISKSPYVCPHTDLTHFLINFSTL
jgi:hypothetical protein